MLGCTEEEFFKKQYNEKIKQIKQIILQWL